eukprot:TRINITY_DN28903_c0_g1_i1.p1 TRINITY_DN28903_c0_g1~~TRINITY_DN28903_c0_g1_i1.p1  ORF type:complete len:107 (+),score=23.97 TRINITY_DN28903_c0_g1_i1:48-368(+)
MKREAFMLRLKKGMEEEYKKRHESVWPEMLDALRKTGWRNYSIFLGPDGILFGYVEVDDSLDEATKRMGMEEVNTKWQEYMKPFFESDGKAADESFCVMKQVFFLE